MPFTWQVDEFKADRNGNPYCEHVNDFVMLSRAEEKHLPNGRVQYVNNQKFFVQHGTIYDEGGSEIPFDAAPEWVQDECHRITADTRRLIGLKLPEDRKREQAETTEALLTQFENLPDELKQALAAKLGIRGTENAKKAPKISSEASGTYPMLPVSDLLADALETVPTPLQAKTWTCDECQETIPLTHKGTHVARLKKLGKCS